METSMMRVRVPSELKEWIETRSIRNFRSMSAEIAAILAAVRQGEEDDPQGFKRLGTSYARETAE